MDFGLSEEQVLLQETVRRFLAAEPAELRETSTATQSDVSSPSQMDRTQAEPCGMLSREYHVPMPNRASGPTSRASTNSRSSWL